MNSLQKILMTLLFLLTVFVAAAQNANVRNNLFYINYGNNLTGYDQNLYSHASFNYEKIFLQRPSKMGYAISTRFGAGKYTQLDAEGPFSILSANYITQRYKLNHMEFGAGASLLYNHTGYLEIQTLIDKGEELPDETKTERRSFFNVLPYAYFGYRYMKPTGSFVFRAGLGFPEAFSVGIGLKL